jgi:hypothetical protein
VQGLELFFVVFAAKRVGFFFRRIGYFTIGFFHRDTSTSGGLE